ncbi:ATP-binding protein [Thermanaerothrix sp.]|jgi:two-component system phosphate regulon sensor histidine kinase PhoR|uniref:hybrid sensor histidine kinase/response regulator n=1 Tax=Thermanaerothrix sp. TaxID=2972675 RepID=UPI002ADE7277|nr:ATP-binding protein [Thermanaerothrix sp.]
MTQVKDTHILIATSDAQVNYLLERVLQAAGYSVAVFQEEDKVFNYLNTHPTGLIILSDTFKGNNHLDLARKLSRDHPEVPILLLVKKDSPELLKEALHLGVSDYLNLPLKSEEVLRAVENNLMRSQRLREWMMLEARRYTDRLQRRVDELETLARLSQSITASLDPDGVLSAIVEAAVELTGAEEGALLLVDEETGELYMRASKNFQEDFVRTFRLPIQDTLAGSVVRTGQPVLLDENTPQKIKTAYLVHGLVYVPLQYKGQVFGVLGVDNRHSRFQFQKRDVQLLTTLADYAAIAIQNARLYNETRLERNKLETVLRRIQDGVIVVDQQGHILLINQAAIAALNLSELDIVGKPARQVITYPELVDLLELSTRSLSNRIELTVEDGRVFDVQRTPIPEVGTAVTLHDITQLKKIDRIKSEFVSTVSHDLRSPLTAILGYVELIERAGPVNELQQEFIRRVQASVQNITHLVDDLVNLGRIEAGFDTRRETFSLKQVLEHAIENFKKALERKGHRLIMELPEDLPLFLGNPVQIRQMFEHLLDNAIKYTPPGGQITIHGALEQEQIILQFRDTGIGIPVADLPFIFDKFYRASNAGTEVAGSGLGLAIVKSIVESHQGRIWVESTLGQGTTFTIVLPVTEA